MTTTMDRETLAEWAAQLTESGASVDLCDWEGYADDDGRRLWLSIEPDDCDPFSEYECWGSVSWDDSGPYDREGTRTNGRPDGFNGDAEKLRLQQGGGWVWWQPPADVKRSDPHFAELRDLVNDLAAFGMSSITVELTEGVDAYGRPIVRRVASLGGLEPFPSADYLAEVVADLLAEVLGDE